MLEKAKKIAAGCSCGKEHRIVTSVLEVGDGATESLVSYVKKRYMSPHALLVCDENTQKYSPPIISALGCRCFVLPGDAHATEVETARLSSYIESIGKNNVEVMIACGSGSVHDITRFCAHQYNVDFISYPTAASVDGFVSGVAAMTMHGQKLTYPSSSPVALFAEPDVFCSAPARLTASGVGDMIGKITALFDWQFSNILTGEPLCRDIFDVMNEALDEVKHAAENEDAVRSRSFPSLIMNGLLLSGLAMQLAGNSRPASGSEHHMSHFWEMHVYNEPTDALHGEKVGVGTVLMLSHIKANADIIYKDINIDECKIYSKGTVEPIYGKLTDSIIAENLPRGAGSSALAKLSKGSLKSNAEKLLPLIEALPPASDISSMLKRVGGCVDLGSLSLPENKKFIETSVTYSPYVRNRLTFAKIISAVSVSQGG